MPYENTTGLPSVTEILNNFIDTEWFTEESRERGTAVHAACHAHLSGDYVLPLRDAWKGYFDSFRIWCDVVHPVVIMAETRLTDPFLKYCGQPDFIGTIRGRTGTGLIDWKTSLSPEKWHRLQGAAYRRLAHLDGHHTQWGGSIRLRADGGMPLFDEWPADGRNDLNIFTGILNAHNFFRR